MPFLKQNSEDRVPGRCPDCGCCGESSLSPKWVREVALGAVRVESFSRSINDLGRARDPCLFHPTSAPAHFFRSASSSCFVLLSRQGFDLECQKPILAMQPQHYNPHNHRRWHILHRGGSLRSRVHRLEEIQLCPQLTTLP